MKNMDNLKLIFSCIVDCDIMCLNKRQTNQIINSIEEISNNNNAQRVGYL